MEENKRTCLYDKHVALGALISPFGGFDMPIQYSDIKDEHRVVDCRNELPAVQTAIGGKLPEILLAAGWKELLLSIVVMNSVAEEHPLRIDQKILIFRALS